MNIINPRTGRPYRHYGAPPSGGRLACGQNRYASTPVSTETRYVNCPDCVEAIEHFGARKVLRGVQQQWRGVTRTAGRPERRNAVLSR